MGAKRFTVVDLFSGAGGMSYGFHAHPDFQHLAAADAEIAKPSMGAGALQCNATFENNIGLAPRSIDLSTVEPGELRSQLGIGSEKIDVLSVCPPCTGFSRTNPLNHLRDDTRNGLVGLSARFAVELGADVVVMENARELIRGNFADHFQLWKSVMVSNGYQVSGKNHVLTRFGLPQIRERAIVFAARRGLPLLDLDALWGGHVVAESATTVRSAFSAIDETATSQTSYPRFADPVVERRLRAIPRDGGSWIDIADTPEAEELLTDSMKRILRLGRIGSHPDVYGRMAWDRPAPTIKRECAHIGNGRYAHPDEHRLCSVREMAILQGFPNQFEFNGTALSNDYRHIGDAVPPLVSFQIASVCAWMLTGVEPALEECILDGTHLDASDIVTNAEQLLFHG